MRKLLSMTLIALLAALVAGLQSPAAARADVVWCEDDPIVEINGSVVNILIGVQDDPILVTKHVKEAVTTIYVPKGVKVKKLGMTNKYFKEKVRFEAVDVPWRQGQPVQALAVVTFESEKHLPARVTVSQLGQQPVIATGDTERPITIRFRVP